jgi:hypothetical protein
MITDKGKNILAKYLIGQAPAYASYIAIGCGAKPLDTSEQFDTTTYKSNTELNFEMFRVPIISRGYVNEGGVPNIVFTAELPTEERYQISEVGVYSGASNPSATGNDSRTIFSFSNRENWEQHGTSSVTAIKRYDDNLSKPTPDLGDMIDTAAAEDAFQTVSSNPFFTIANRANRNEDCRFLNNTILLKGTQSNLDTVIIDGKTRLEEVPDSGSKHIHLNAIGINLEKNAPNDLMKIAFSVVSKNIESPQPEPDEIRIMVEFAHDDAGSQYAKFDAIVTNNTNYDNEPGDESFVYPPEVDFTDNRYYVVSRELQELHKSTAFSWGQVAIVKIYATVIKSGSPSADYFVCLDALRLDNVATENPLYGLTGYSPVKSLNATPILKDTNTKNFVEFRFAMGVDDGIVTS